jgi:hypothetical protein
MSEDSQNVPEWLQQFAGAQIQSTPCQAATLASVDAEGWPHLSYLSIGEIFVRAGIVSIALWPNSRSTANIARNGQAVLHAAWEGAVWEARLAMKSRENGSEEGSVIFDGTIVECRRHAAPYADVLHMMLFKLHDPSATVARWEVQMKRLRGI